jgi:hypothetical protein
MQLINSTGIENMKYWEKPLISPLISSITCGSPGLHNLPKPLASDGKKRLISPLISSLLDPSLQDHIVPPRSHRSNILALQNDDKVAV